ncbi:MAG: phosphate-selective porin O and P, partial [Gammaproteobacteria bacterium]|nr:phosphate-selective porin O and P [Gammaproteobacteria bacterium]
MKTKFKQVVLTAASVAILSAIASSAQAANWLMLQGTEPAGAGKRAHVWGFIQAQYQKDDSKANATDGYVPPKLIGPNLDDQSQFNVNRARIGVR